MKYDVIVIGGGLSGMLTAISLQQEGKKTAVISAGESTLYFSTGAIKGSLSPEEITRLENCGVKIFKGGFRLTPAGELVKADYSFSPCSALEKDDLTGLKATVFNLAGFSDFPTALVAAGLEKRGAECTIKELKIKGLESARANLTEYRSTTIARELESKPALVEEIIAEVSKAEGIKVLPAVFYEGAQIKVINALKDVLFAGTIPPTAPTFSLSQALKAAYLSTGGFIFKGERAVNSSFTEDGLVEAVYCERLGNEPLKADKYVLATGSFFSKGLVSNYDKIWEPVFNLDVKAPEKRLDWLSSNFWADQPYMAFGVVTSEGKAVKDGKVINNLYAVGSVTGEGSEHKSIVTAFETVDRIIKEK